MIKDSDKLILAGVRPTGVMTLANYIGSIKQILKYQESGNHTVVFVADEHALTDSSPKDLKNRSRSLLLDFLAFGIDTSKTELYIQSSMASYVHQMSAILSRYITVSELLRVPTLKNKVKGNEMRANAMLLMYPVMMTADILLNKATHISIGKDQIPHIELAKIITQRLNKSMSTGLIVPESILEEPCHILALNSLNKMSKSDPRGAILMSDSKKDIEKKIKTAVTATTGVMSPNLENLIRIAKEVAPLTEKESPISEIIADHLSGKQVMGALKQHLNKVLSNFVLSFQEKRDAISDNAVSDVINSVNIPALDRAATILEHTTRCTLS